MFTPNDITGAQRAICIVEELGHAMGINNDLPHYHSVFSDEVEVPDLTETDEAVLRALYSAELRSGLSRAQTLHRVRA